MALPNNVQLFEECLAHPEPLIDPFYCNESRIISLSPADPATEVMTANAELLERISAASVAIRDKDKAAYQRCVERIATLLQAPGMNFTEFTSFFPALDVSYSMYMSLSSALKIEFLHQAVRLFIEKRHNAYRLHGYSATTLQVRKDFEKHKTEGSAGARKVKAMLDAQGYSAHAGGKFGPGAKSYIFVGRGPAASQALEDMRSHLGLEFEWQRHHQDKNVDLYLSHSTNIVFVCEFKHVKEGGGGQHKQVVEVISLIRYGERDPRIGYVAFLDGMYFNEFIAPSAPKTREQARQIRQHLAENPRNYFLNTHGLEKLLASSK